MSLLKELAGENMLYMALQGCRAVLERELDIKQVTFSLSETTRQDIVRKSRESGLAFPYSFINLTALAGVKEQQNNMAVRKHGVRFYGVGESASSKKGYLFPITLGLDFHYIDSDQTRLLNMAQSLVLLSLTDGLTFQIDVGNIFSFVVRLEIPSDTTINISEENNTQLPGASDINVNLVMHTQIGFFRDVSAVNGSRPILNVSVEGAETFQMELP